MLLRRQGPRFDSSFFDFKCNQDWLVSKKLSWQLKYGGLAQLARASALHAEGHRFDSDILHSFELVLYSMIMA